MFSLETLSSTTNTTRTYVRTPEVRTRAGRLNHSRIEGTDRLYAKSLGVGAVFKRLGYLLEQLAPEEQAAIDACAASMTQGYAKLDPTLPPATLVTRWRLWLPEGWPKR